MAHSIQEEKNKKSCIDIYSKMIIIVPEDLSEVHS